MPCRNTATNETAWELPAGAALAGNQPSSLSSAAAVATAADAATTQQQQQGPAISFEALLQELQEAYDADGSGMGFWEAARARRKVGSLNLRLRKQQHSLAGAQAAMQHESK
jgi:hypothetical protein